MEKLGGGAKAIGGCSRSFRLRSPSLNRVRLRRIFDTFDKNKDCILTVEELTHALAVLGLQTDHDCDDLESMVQPYIPAGKHGLTYPDFEALHTSLNDAFFPKDSSQEYLNESDLCEAFKVFDEDGDGFISASELQAVLAKLGLLVNADQLGSVELMISSVDQNHDGLVDFFEFKDMMRNVIIDVPN